MPARILHIVSFDYPFPPVYGGTIEVFSKLRPLHESGVEIHLHCFSDQLPPQTATDTYCARIYYYRNARHAFDLLSWLPFSVQTRDSAQLRKNIEALPGPILFEGLKTTYGVFKNWFADQRLILRLHNIEHLYFLGIARSERRWSHKISYYLEGIKYRRYEKIIGKFNRVAALSHFEQQYVSGRYLPADYIPVFHGNETVAPLEGMGQYALYHGDLRMSDNRRVAESLVDLFREIPDVTLVIAGNADARAHFENYSAGLKNVRYETLRDFEHLKQLLGQAHINLVFSFQQSGTKLKLMNALFYSRFCVINSNVMDDALIQPLCLSAESPAEIRAHIDRLKHQPFEDYGRRKSVLETHMSDRENARKLLDLIFE